MGDRVAVMKNGRLMQCAPPQELYEDPANVFVAGFIGSPKMNLFHSTLTRRRRIGATELRPAVTSRSTADCRAARPAPARPPERADHRRRPTGGLRAGSRRRRRRSHRRRRQRRRDARVRDARLLRRAGRGGVRRRRARPRPGLRRGGEHPRRGRHHRHVRPARAARPAARGRASPVSSSTRAALPLSTRTETPSAEPGDRGAPGGATRSSTRSTRAASPTPTATASATSPASSRGCRTCAQLGVDALWMTPFYPSPMADGGLRRRRLPRRRPAVRHARRRRGADRRAHGAGCGCIARHRPEPHLDEHRWFRGARRRRAGVAARALLLPRRARADGAEPPTTGRALRRPGLDAASPTRRPAGPVVPAPVRPRAARLQLGAPGGGRRVRATCCGSGSTAASTGSASTPPTVS